MTSIKQWFRRSAALGVVAGGAAVAGACGITTQQEVEMGRQYAAEINRQLPIVNDAAVNRYINDLGRSIARHGPRRIGYQFFVVNAEQINAFAVPGGYIYVNRGLVEQTRNMSELAGVLAHEIAHVEHRHGIDQMERMQTANIGLTALYVLTGRTPTGLDEAAVNVLGGLYFARHSREAENEADREAVGLLVRSGIDPNGLTSFFNVLLAEQRRSPTRVEQWFSTHPLTTDRVAQTQAVIRQVPAAQLRGLRQDAQDYQAMKARLRQLPPPPAQYRVAR
jgi:beta-barrel assembly-enhancing protease